MPKALRYGLVIVVIAMLLYLVARNFDDVIYSMGRAVFEAKEQEQEPDEVFMPSAGETGTGVEAVN